MQFGDMERTYRMAVPKSYDARSSAPLVLNFHGLGSSARQEERYSRIVEVADAHGFIAATVDGTGNPRHWTLAAGEATDTAQILHSPPRPPSPRRETPGKFSARRGT